MVEQSIYEDALINNIVIEGGEYLTILEWIQQKLKMNIEFSMDLRFMKRILGPEFAKEDRIDITNSLRNVLRKYNIGINRLTLKNGHTKLTIKPLLW